jgi:two-component system, chemotaxis family, sensor kinase CheA
VRLTVSGKDDNLMRRLRETFKVEAQEHIQSIAAGLLELERTATVATQTEVLDTTFRAAHSLKGAARTVNARDIETLCQSLESVFAALKRTEIALSAELFDLLHRVVSALGSLLQFIDTGSAIAHEHSVTDLVHSLQTVLTTDRWPAPLEPIRKIPVATATSAAERAQAAVSQMRGASDTIRVATAKLDAVLLQTEELLSAKLAAVQQASGLRQCQAGLAEWRKRWGKLRPDLSIIRQALENKALENNKNGNGGSPASATSAPNAQWLRVIEFLEWNQHFVESLDVELRELAKAADHNQRFVGAMVDALLDDMKKVVMQPFSTLLDVFPRFVRELSRDQRKDIELRIEGGDIEIDRRVLEEIKDPLIHLVRNCLDHGIETPEARTQRGKPPQGAITIGVAARDGSSVELLVADDGAGIDAGTVKASAVKLGLLAPENVTTLHEQEALSLIFQSGVSTSPIITDLSGRGLGLAIVKEKVEKLRGSLSVETEAGHGTTFRIILPLTLARFRGTLVRAREHLFVLPTSNVERVMRVRSDDIKTVENRETVVLGGQALSLVRLTSVLELTHSAGRNDEPAVQIAVVLISGHQRIAFVIDEVLGEQEVLVKTLGKQLARVRNIAGATILGNGKVVPILNVADLMKSVVRTSAARVAAPAMAGSDVADRKKSVLVAEDSITSRILLKNILETAGYQVETAVDGIDAFTKLRSGAFDALVSDVEMPRLNGFGLTSKVRADKTIGELPVVLVTALDSREDREQGIDVGANAYIVKGSFDQSNLLQVIGRLI